MVENVIGATGMLRPGAPPRRPRGSGAVRRGELGTRVTPGLYLAKYRVVGRRGQVGPATWRLGPRTVQ
ncbi:hypothetical protein GS506_18730 [Rhodococcus hoagii]|nr:hypothetical protein [Prescottella equi]